MTRWQARAESGGPASQPASPRTGSDAADARFVSRRRCRIMRAMDAEFHVRWTVALPPDVGERIRHAYPSFGDPRELPRDPLDQRAEAFRGVCAFLDGENAGLLDGRTLQFWRRDVPDAPRWSASLVMGGLGPTMTLLSDPWLTPIAVLGAGKRLLLLRGYNAARDRDYEAVPVIFDPAAVKPFRALRPSGRDVLGGTTPEQVFVAADLSTAWIAGEVDAGAACHIDDFIPVAVAYALDLATGCYAWVKAIPVRAWQPPGVIVAGLQYCVADGRVDLQPWERPRVLPDGDTLKIALADRDPRTFTLPLARRLADPDHVRRTVAASRAGDDVLVLDTSAGDIAVIHHVRVKSGG